MSRRRLLSIADLADLPAPEFLLDPFVTKGGFNVLFGPSGVGKSFLALSWALHIETGRPWFGQNVPAYSGTPVVYIAAEGVAGLDRRIAAALDANLIPPYEASGHFHAFPGPVNFFEGDTAELVVGINELGHTPGLIVVDTLARCMVGGEENSAKDVGIVIEAITDLCDRFDAAALVIHHTGKNGELERGSSALRAAADTVLALKESGGGMELSCVKQKDAPEFEPWKLHLAPRLDSVSIRLGTDLEQLGAQEQKLLESVSESFGTDWASATAIKEAADLPKSTFYRALNGLVEGDRLEKEIQGRTQRYRVSPTVPSSPNGSRDTDQIPSPKSHPPLRGGTDGTGGVRDGEEVPR